MKPTNPAGVPLSSAESGTPDSVDKEDKGGKKSAARRVFCMADVPGPLSWAERWMLRLVPFACHVRDVNTKQIFLPAFKTRL